LKRIAGSTVSFLGEIGDAALESEYRDCRALIFTADEDFGIAPLEAMASGRPVLALNKGGARETVVPHVTGEFYEDAGVESLVDALQHFRPNRYDPVACRGRAEEFSVARFREGILRAIEDELGPAFPE
jgi:glycosyltransferase involved in cell wall biosynthesis